MTRFIGAIFVFGACVYIGFMKSVRMRRREKWLLNMRAFLNMLDIQIQFSSDRLERCIKTADKHTDLGEFLSYIAEHISFDGIQKAWIDSVRLNTAYLENGDKEVLYGLGAWLGMTDRENQYKNICCTKELIDKQYEQARTARERTARLYESGGVLVGAFAVLMLI